MSLKSKIINNRRIDKFVNLLGHTINTAFWLSPAIGSIYSYTNDLHMGITIVSGVVQLFLTGLHGALLSENNKPNWGYPIKKLLKSIPNKILNNKYRDLIIQQRMGSFSESDIVNIAQHYLYAPQLSKIESFPYMFGAEIIKEDWYELPNMKEFNKLLRNYEFNDREKSIMQKVRQEHMLHSHLFITEHKKDNSDIAEAYMKRTKFILQQPYTLKEKDYEEITKYFKNPHNDIDINFFLTHENIIADWKYLKSIFLKTYLVENNFYYSVINVLDNKPKDRSDTSMSAKQLSKEDNKILPSVESIIGEETHSVISNPLLFNHLPVYNADKWETLKENFNYLNKSVYIEEFNKQLLESLPVLIAHDKKINSLKSKKAKDETKKYLTSILDILIELSNGYIESLELSRTKDLKVLHKYNKMAK